MNVHRAIAIAEELLPGIPAPEDEDDPRWQEIIHLGEFIPSDPEPIWLFIARWGVHEQADIRAAVATVLLEHLLEHHFDAYFAHVEQLAKSDNLFADTFRGCWKLGQSELLANAKRFDALLERCKH